MACGRSRRGHPPCGLDSDRCLHGARTEHSCAIAALVCAAMSRGPSLAQKCQFLFAAAAMLILAGALVVPWLRLGWVVDESQRETSRQLAETWVQNGFALMRTEGIPIPIRVVQVDQIESTGISDPFVDAAERAFSANPTQTEVFEAVKSSEGIVYRYALALRETQWRAIQDRQFLDFSARASEVALGDPLRAVLVIERTSQFAAGQIASNRWYLVVSGVVAVLLAVVVFWWILTQLIFSPVRRLRDSMERVRRGDLTVRSNLRTGDELEELSRAFDQMLDELDRVQHSLRSMNESLDLKVVQLSEANVGLFESNRLKSDFVASVSHELRTPLNSIIGFAELLEEMARKDADADPKRLRYAANILTSARMLLEMINELLDMAKIQAGRMSASVVSSSILDLLEGLQALMKPQAMSKIIEMELHVDADIPSVETDPGKLQQILYNFLSNAIKFSPAGSTIRIEAGHTTLESRPAVRIAIVDQGPGIPFDLQETVFEKFRQIDASHTRSHGGTGLGLAICRELAQILGCTVGLISEPGRGATFFVSVPVIYRARERKPLMSPAAVADGASNA
ncbi:MAG: HAMP domain-containing protein [Planctomycetes bacterium]|nr:HAMP domain-containing protein [Planctomycetota bacterium]